MLYAVIIYHREGIRTTYHATECEARETADLFRQPDRIDAMGIGDIVITKTIAFFDCRASG